MQEERQWSLQRWWREGLERPTAARSHGRNSCCHRMYQNCEPALHAVSCGSIAHVKVGGVSLPAPGTGGMV
eukprot:304372-Chlamydomonas_euryale.AAC.2